MDFNTKIGEKIIHFGGGTRKNLLTMQRHKDVKCRSTFETGSNLAKDFKDRFLITSSLHSMFLCLSTTQQKWILALPEKYWLKNLRKRKTGGGNPGTKKIPITMSLDRCAVVIDVREQWEWDAGHVSCATRLQIQKILKLQGENLRTLV